MSNIGETIKKFALIVFFIGAVITCICAVLYFKISVIISLENKRHYKSCHHCLRIARNRNNLYVSLWLWRTYF